VSQEYLNDLNLSDEERAKLAKFGAKTPKALLSMRRASREAFDDYVGRGRAEAIASELEKLLTDEEREALKGPPRGAGKLGARLEPSPRKRTSG
jgi:hypothetical protein